MAVIKVSVVIPAYNEEKNLPHLLERLNKVAHKDKRIAEILVVDDGSRDKTADVARKYGCTVFTNPVNLGKGGALKVGFKEAVHPIIVMLDADLSHIPEDIPKLIDPFTDSTVGLVQASRSLGGSEEYGFIRAIGNIFLTACANTFMGVQMTDALNGFKAFRKEITSNLTARHFDIEIELLARCMQHGYTIAEVASQEKSRLHGQSNLKAAKDGWRFFSKIVREGAKARL